MASKTKITFKTVDVDGKEISLDVRKPTTKTIMEADKLYNRTFMQALASESPLRAKIQKIVKDQGVWDDEKQAELDAIDKSIAANEKVLASGGIKKSQGRKIAIQLRKDRNTRSNLLSRQNELDNISCESQAENRQFECYVALGTLDSETGDPYFKNLEDYDNRKDEKASIDAAMNMMFLIHKVDPDYLKQYPENRFLKEYGFCDDEYRLIDSNGHLCDEDYRKINDKGYYVNDLEEIVDRDGNRINEDGTPLVEFVAFLDD